MDFKFSKDEGGSTQQGVVEEKGKQNVLLVVLLILVAGFGYVYFFTDLIKPAQVQKVAEVPPVPQVVKKPLPVPGGEAAKAAPAGSEEKKDVAGPVKAEPVKAAPVPVPAVAKPAAQEAVKPKVEAKKTDASQPAVKSPVPVVAKAVENKPVPVPAKQPAGTAKSPLPAKDGEKKTAAAKKTVEKISARADAPPHPAKKIQKTALKKPAASGAAVVPGRWTVLVGNYVLEEALAADLARVRKAGVEAAIVPGAQKKSHMNRLLLAEFTDRASAQNELGKLKKYTSDAFIIESAGMHAVYAGSYLLDARALSEKDRLAAVGFSLALKRADVSIPTKNLTAGSFVDKSAAEETLKKLRAAGVKATLSR